MQQIGLIERDTDVQFLYSSSLLYVGLQCLLLQENAKQKFWLNWVNLT